ncbi:hypothetical protein SAMN02983003_3385 [Devosia enhydra]|uniref:Tat pathway signal sequence domain protein n=1 Tax=Devosia enhydra TaxID=665118 RepID=A0A1K2I1E4_9HYPH|nr:hypothetical protein [Devosia enhydra]SFZ86210.1 hypothetical protein SAMN02983003_3385 [Devosia enhydra]
MKTALLALALCVLLVGSGFAVAQEASAPAPALSLELNALQPVEDGCRVTFLATNGLGHPLDRAAVEMAFFGASGAIDRIVTLDFRALAEGKTKVLQFQLARLDCAAVSRVLVNDITACEGEGLAPTACLAGLAPSARPDIAFGV